MQLILKCPVFWRSGDAKLRIIYKLTIFPDRRCTLIPVVVKAGVHWATDRSVQVSRLSNFSSPH
jgi:hypothetical protein